MFYYQYRYFSENSLTGGPASPGSPFFPFLPRFPAGPGGPGGPGGPVTKHIYMRKQQLETGCISMHE